MIETDAININHVSTTYSWHFADYFALAKPGITLVVLMMTMAGFILASPVPAAPNGSLFFFDLNWTKLFHTLLGTAMVSAGAGALNMFSEVESDALMVRTKNRPLPTGRLSCEKAFLFGILSASIGIVHIADMVNPTASLIASISLALYLVFYTPMKKTTGFCIIIGAISGALPPLIGWTAVKGPVISFQGWLLFFILFVWQFPHLLALVWMYRDDYERAGFKMVPLSQNYDFVSGKIALLSCFILLPLSLIPYWVGLSGTYYLYSAFVSGLMLIGSAFYFFTHRNYSSAKTLFFSSVAYVPILFGLMVVGR